MVLSEPNIDMMCMNFVCLYVGMSINHSNAAMKVSRFDTLGNHDANLLLTDFVQHQCHLKNVEELW